jgi:hypothetical protein
MDASRSRVAARHRQRGWAGLIGLLIALVIVAWLGRILIAKLLPSAPPADAHGVHRVPGGAAPADVDPTTATPVPRTELERARNLQADVQKQAADLEKRIDEGTK